MSQYIYMIPHAVCHYDSQIPSFVGGGIMFKDKFSKQIFVV